MNSSSSRIPIALVALIAAAVVACEVYEPPPEVRLVRSGAGAYTPGEPLPLEFSDAVAPETLELSLWPSERGVRRVAQADVEALVGPCNAGTNNCSELSIDVDDDATEAYVTVQEPFGAMGSHFVLEVAPGLSDRAGNSTGVSRYFNVRYRGPTDPDPNANIEFDNGTYIFGGSVEEPMRAVLTLVSDVRILPDGRLAVAGAKGDVVDDDAPDTSRDPEHIEVDDGTRGWALFFTGLVIENEEGRRFMETEVFDVNIPVLSHLTLIMEDVRLFAEIIKDDDGNDLIDGTLTYERIFLGDEEFDGDSTALIGEYVPPELAPEGTPDICENPCGGIVGQCEIPEGFPHPDFCDEQ